MDEKQEVQRLRQRVQLLEALIDKQTTLLYQKPGHAIFNRDGVAACMRPAASSAKECRITHGFVLVLVRRLRRSLRARVHLSVYRCRHGQQVNMI